MKPTVSILVPSYNHAAYIGACLASVQAQTMDSWELDLVDDGSADETLARAREAAEGDPRIRLAQNPSNLGTYGTLQRALSLGSAPYVAVLNSDDLWEPEKLERQVRALEAETPAGLCYTLGVRFGDEGESDVHGDWPVGELQDPLPLLLAENRILASSVLFRRDRLRFETTCRYSGDWVALLEQTWDRFAACIPEPLTRWRVHGANTFTQSPGQVREEIRVRQAIATVGWGWITPTRPAQAVRRGLAQNALHLAAAHVFFGERLPALQSAAASIRLAGTATAWKRLAAAALPIRVARRRLWGNAPKPDPLPPAPPLELRRP
ncbi:MAG: glycosyltransferase family 2 protein [Fimbriimonadaceae bacterium]|nr:glycosyltransferase family 2 protein [Fimbriimonadaceae bacterium]